jgi:hypothetical protein
MLPDPSDRPSARNVADHLAALLSDLAPSSRRTPVMPLSTLGGTNSRPTPYSAMPRMEIVRAPAQSLSPLAGTLPYSSGPTALPRMDSVRAVKNALTAEDRRESTGERLFGRLDSMGVLATALDAEDRRVSTQEGRMERGDRVTALNARAAEVRRWSSFDSMLMVKVG